MYSKVLIPLDGSKTAERVLPYSRYLAGRFKIPVELLSIIDIGGTTMNHSTEKAGLLNTVTEERVSSSENYLRGIAATFPGIEAKCTVEKGRPAEAIIEKAGPGKSTLINMATHGLSGVKRWLLGSVAAKVIQAAEAPLLLVRASGEAVAKDPISFESIIVPLDGSELAEQVLPHVVDLARAMNVEVVLVRAFELPGTAYYGADDLPPSAATFIPTYEELVEELSRETCEYLDAKVKELWSRGLEKIRAETREGAAADVIINEARKTPDSLVVMCTHGLSGLKRWVLGSVTEKVVNHVESPLLIIRAR